MAKGIAHFGISCSPGVYTVPNEDLNRPDQATMNKTYCTYILASKRNGALYIGMTQDLADCVLDHKCNMVAGITSQYAIHQLVYFEYHQDTESASLRECSIKQMHRIWKLDLIERHNPQWRDLYQDIAARSPTP